jgi:hypothetical protein
MTQGSVEVLPDEFLPVSTRTSVNFDAFMRIRSYPSEGNLAENPSFKRSGFQEAEYGGGGPERHFSPV